MTITPFLFEAFLKCPTKCWLRFTGEQTAGNAYAEWVETEHESYRADAARRLIANAPAADCAVAPIADDRLVAYCSSCEHHEPTAIPFGDDHLCLNCLEHHSSAGKCGWCGDLITGDTSGTSVWGCFRCPGPDLDRD